MGSLKGLGETVLAAAVTLAVFGVALGSTDILSLVTVGLFGGLIIGSALYGLGLVFFKLISASSPSSGSGRKQRFNSGERVLIYFAIMAVVLILRYLLFGGL